MFGRYLAGYGHVWIGIALGALGGFLYWKYVGCVDGTCPITSSPVYSSLWGAAVIGLLFASVRRKPRKGKGEE